MKKFILILISAFLATSTNIQAQAGYKIKIQVNGMKDSSAYLAYYYGKGQYYRDTSAISSNGTILFTGEDTLEHGMYSLIISNAKIIDFMVDNQEFSLLTDTTNVISSMKVKGSPENKIFYEYLNFLNVRQKEAASLSKRLAEADTSEKKEIEKRMSELDNEVRNYIQKLHEDHSKTLTSNFIYALAYPEVPEPPLNEDGSVDSTFAFRYYKSHYFDNFDFTDERLLRTSTFHDKMMYYMNKLTLQQPDSVIIAVDYFLDKAAQDKELFKYALTNLTSKYERSEQMGMDAVFVHLAKNYFMKGKADEWFDEKQLEKLAERALALDPLLIGKKAPNIVVKDTAQKKFLQLYEVDAKYTIVYIWSPECGHCKVATPKLKKLYDQYKDRGVEVFAVGNEFENEEWKEFIRKHDLNWINGSDGGDFRSNFRTLYDVYSTPQTYLLDEDKKILSKKMSVESLENMLEYYFKENPQENSGNEK